MEVFWGLMTRPTLAQKSTAQCVFMRACRWVGEQASKVTSSAYWRLDTWVPSDRVGPMLGAVDSDITVDPVKKQTKKSGAEGAPLFDTSLGRERRANPIPNLDSKAGGSIKGFHSSKHATMNSKAAQNLPQEGTMHKIVGRLKV
jgi:hypothetical protein